MVVPGVDFFDLHHVVDGADLRDAGEAVEAAHGEGADQGTARAGSPVALPVARAPAARRLSDEITAAMQTLAMAGGRFEVALAPCEPAATGLELVEFRVSANPGQPLRSLAKVASGGELSRFLLALKVCLGELSLLLLGGQKAVPARLLEAGFTFQFTDLRAALDDLSSRL